MICSITSSSSRRLVTVSLFDRYTLRCLQHLSRSPSFFQRRHIVLGVEPLIRVIPHLVTTHGAPGGGLSVAYAVHLLSEMLVR